MAYRIAYNGNFGLHNKQKYQKMMVTDTRNDK